MNPLVVRVVSYVRERRLLTEGARILIALSGGPDSCALLLAFREASREGLLPEPVGAAHFHHGVRGRDADEDAAFCAALCARLGWPCVIGLGAVPTRNAVYGNAVARDLRYGFLREAAEDLTANVLATAHTADDQAETVLGRILRGTGIDGLAGIPSKRALSDRLTVIRPLLGVRRSEIEAYCREKGVTPRQDPSNLKDRYLRTRIRTLLPELVERFNPQVFAALNRLADSAAADADLLRALAEELQRTVILSRTAEATTLDRVRLNDAHPALRRRVLLSQIRRFAGSQMEEAATTEWIVRLERLLVEEGTVTLPGRIQARSAGNTLIFRSPIVLRPPEPFSQPLPVPGQARIDSVGLCVRAEIRPVDHRAVIFHTPEMSPLPSDPEGAGIAPLEVRSLRVGERIEPFGMGGRSRPVRDCLAEKGVPAENRENYPVVAQSDTGAIVWVVGIIRSERTRIAPNAQSLVLLTADRIAEEKEDISNAESFELC
ncbi:MAG: tRNA lysidine(34) synthetase TilS [Capsulimonadales bacterium]|nr:tRNA lysidine(34) synthetase TilS [Capsulimonadales bacterium]